MKHFIIIRDKQTETSEGELCKQLKQICIKFKI